MSTVIENIERIETAKVNIKTAIEDKGVAVPETATLDAYPDLIGQIQGGGGEITAEMMRDMGFGGSTFSQLPDMFKNADWSLKIKMNYCFAKCSSLASISLPSLPNVNEMDSCFETNKSLTSISLPSLPKVFSMQNCFYYCGSLTSITLPELPKVTSMYYCFAYCTSLTSINLPELPKVSNMGSCFNNCTSLENLVIGNLNPAVSNWTNWKLDSCTKLTVDSLVNVLNALPERTGTNTCTLGTTNLNKLSDEQKAIATNKGWTLN